MKPWAEKLYNSKTWHDCRDGYIKSVNGLCERCLKEGKIEPGKIVHHKIYLTPENINNPNIALNWDNLEYVCQDHHNFEHFESDEEVTAEGLMFNEMGELVRKEERPRME